MSEADGTRAGERRGADARVRLCAMGSHPAWSRPRTEPGIESESVAFLARLLGLDRAEGPARSGAPSRILVRVWRAEIVVARVWSWSDTGPSMGVFCACQGFSLGWVLDEVLPRLERLERRCREASADRQLDSALESTRAELASRGELADAIGGPLPSQGAVMGGALRAAGSRDALARLVRQSEIAWSAYASNAREMVRAPIGRLRVPTGGGELAQVARTWIAFARAGVGEAHPVTFVRHADGGAWAEILVGDGLPPESPGERDGAPTAHAPKVSDPQGAMASVSVRVRGARKLLSVVLAATVLVGAGVWIAWHFSGRAGGSAPAASGGTGVPISPTPDVPELPEAPAGGEAWQRLCEAYESGASAFVRALDHAPSGATGTRRAWYRGDADLRGVVDALDQHTPWDIAGVARDVNVRELRERPPAVVDERGGLVAEGLAAVEALRGFAASWGAMERLTRGAAELEAAGYRSEAAFIRRLTSDLTRAEPDVLVVAIDEVLRADTAVAAMRVEIARIEEAVAMCEASGDATLSLFGRWAAEVAPARRIATRESMTLLAAELVEAGSLAGSIARFLREDWPETDRGVLAERIAAELTLHEGRASRATFVAWLRIASESGRMSMEDDPRAGLRTLLEAVEELAGDGGGEARGEVIRRARAELQALEAQVLVAGSAVRIGVASRGIERRLLALRVSLEAARAFERAAGALELDEARTILASIERVVATSGVLNAAWRERRDGVLNVQQDPADLVRVARGFADDIRAVDERVPAGLEFLNGSELDLAVCALSWARREESLSAVISTDENGAGEIERARLAAASFGETRAALDRFRRDAMDVERTIRRGASLRERLDSGEPVAAVVERLRTSEILRDESVARAAGPLLEDARLLARVDVMVGVAELVEVIRLETEQRWYIALHAWRRLDQVAWPGSPVDLRTEHELSGSLRRVIEREAGEAGVAERIGAEIEQRRAARWARCFIGLRTAEDIEAGAAWRLALGAEPQSLPARARYNVALAGARAALDAGGLSEDEARGVARDLSAALEGLVNEVGGGAGVAGLRNGLRALLEQEELAVFLPGPWRVQVEEGRVRLNVGDAAPATFEAAPVEGGGVAYVGTAEVSVDLATAILNATEGWDDFRACFAPEDIRDNAHVGRSWVWLEGGRIGAASAWRPGIEGESPSGAHPLNDLPPAAAVLLARLAGCRLPTLGEWRAAADRSGASNDLPARNLRDQRWGTAFRSDDSTKVAWEDELFIATGGLPSDRGRADALHPWDDGTGWLRPVGGDDLVGNVAEYVYDGPARDMVGDAAGPSHEAAVLLVSQRIAGLRVVGGSAGSPVAHPPTTALRVEPSEVGHGYADVGLRLAFTAPTPGASKPLGVRLAELLARAPYFGGARAE